MHRNGFDLNQIMLASGKSEEAVKDILEDNELVGEAI
jgi:hypothetical protein